MANGGGGKFPICKLGALLVIVGMTALPFVSCGMLEIHGHYVLRNKVPEFEELEQLGKGFNNSLTESMNESLGAKPGDPIDHNLKVETTDTKPEALFEGGDLWIWFLYLGIFGLGVTGLFFRDRVKATAFMGVAGVIGVMVWIGQFENSLLSRGDADAQMPSGFSVFETDTGAYMTYAGFLLFIVAAVWNRTGGAGSSATAAPEGPPPQFESAPAPPSVPEDPPAEDLIDT